MFDFNKSIRAARGSTPYAVLLIACLLLNALTYSVSHCISHQQDEQIELCSLHKPVESGRVSAVETPPAVLSSLEALFAIEHIIVHIAAPVAVHPVRAPPVFISS